MHAPLPTGELGLPIFAQISDDDWLPAFEAAMSRQLAALEELAVDSAPATIGLIHAWESSGLALNRVCNAFYTCKDADSSEARDQVESTVAPMLARHYDAVMMDRRLYDRLRELADRVADGQVEADDEDRWWLSERLRKFVRAGITLSPADQDRLKQVNQRIAECESAYLTLVVAGRGAAAVHFDDLAQLDGLPAEQLDAARRAAAERGLDGWVIELVNTTRQPVLAWLNDRSSRRRIFEASVARGQSDPADTRQTILDLARLRAEKAQLLGFEHYAAYVADDGCAKTTSAVMSLLVRSAEAAMANARREAAGLQDQLSRLLPGATLEAWDWAWLAERDRTAKAFDEAELMAYLEFETVLEQGVFAAATRLYGLGFRLRTDLAGYTDECRTYEVRDADGELIGLLQLDPYSRPSKQGGAWMTSLVEQGHFTSDRPVATNNCNQTRPAPGQPSLMTWDEVITLFHEFGHDLHALLASSRYPSLSGTNTPRDFVEFPSQVNQMWAWDQSVVAGFARHAVTGQPLPDGLRDAVLASQSAGMGFDSLEIIAAMLLDQAWHQAGLADLPVSVDQIDAFEQAALGMYGVDYALIPPRYRTCYFSHIWGDYAAGYYGYLWAEVLDADTVAWFAENGGLTRRNGDTFRRLVLSVGGSCDVMEAYRAFRGGDPDPIHLFRRRGLV